MRSYSIAAWLFLAAAAVGFGVWVAVDYVADGPNSSHADKLAAVASAGSFALAVVTVCAAIFTVLKQNDENRLQRQMETVHQLTERYEQIFDEVLQLQGKPELHDPKTIEHFYNRYFTALMRNHRCYQTGLISKDDFEEWTATAIGRFRRGGSQINLSDTSRDDKELRAQWHTFDERGVGPREDFRKYMAGVMAAAERTKWATPLTSERKPEKCSTAWAS